MQAIPMIITKDEATAAQRTLVFYAVDAADGFTPETGIDFTDAGDVKLSKAGGALANAAGAVTELASGLYKLVLAAADVDTLGLLTVLITNAGVRPVVAHIQVVATDPNDPSGMPDNAITASKIAADAITSSELSATAASEIRTGLATSAEVAAITLATRTVVKNLGTIEEDGTENTDGDYMAISILDAIDATVNVSGTWDGATLTVQVCEDPTAAVPVWTDFDDSGGSNANPLTDDGSVIVTGAHSAVRVIMSNDGAGSAVEVSVSIRKPQGT